FELSSVSCKYGKWHFLPAVDSVINKRRDLLSLPKTLQINSKTNLVCEGRADYLVCDEPEQDCYAKGSELDSNLCMEAKKNSSGQSIHCEKENFHLVLRKRYYEEGKAENITSIKSEMTCDRRSRR
ncbi:hypothetical protein PMAYCL1PPCAC_12042, partial [Pristionchus mayeri]